MLVKGSEFALVKAMTLAVTEGGFITPNSEVRGSVTALVEVKSGHCKSLSCAIAVRNPKVRSLRITEHHAKCKSVPAKVKECAVEELGRSAVKRQGNEAV